MLGRLANPRHVWRIVMLQRGRDAGRRREDRVLQFIAEVLPGGFLHYGYFDDVDRQPEEVSLNDIARAQLRYAELVADQIENGSGPVLDVGSGMGGMIGVLQKRGLSPVALTPDRTQIEHIRSTYPDVPAIHAKLEDLAKPEHREHIGRYGTVITAESLQYLKLDGALPVIGSLLKPSGRWIVCDFFRREADQRRGRSAGHDWADFRVRLDQAGWHVLHERDITRHVLPTLRCLSMCATRFGLPVLRFASDKLRRKQPGMHYLLEDVLKELEVVVADHLELVNPDTFAARKKYVLMALVKSEDDPTGPSAGSPRTGPTTDSR